MNIEQLQLRDTTRREFFANAGLNIGSLGLATVLSGGNLLGAPSRATNPLAVQDTHFPAKAKRVIFMFMAGGPSHIDLFDEKPKLNELHGQVIPKSYVENKRFAFIKQDAKLLGSQRQFKKYGESGQNISELLPHLTTIADDIAIVRSMKTEVFNHGPAKLFTNTGFQRFGRPSMGAWITYGIGSESNNLPGFVVLQSGPRGPRGGTPLWGSGFLPTTYQGVPFLNGPSPILHINNPQGVNRDRQKIS